MTLPAVAHRRLALYQAALFELAEHPAQIAGIEVERAADIACGRRAAARDLVKHARLAERERAVEKSFAQDADLPRVEAVEAAHRCDACFGDAMLAIPGHAGRFNHILDLVKDLWRGKGLGRKLRDPSPADPAQQVGFGIERPLGMAVERLVEPARDQ